LHLFFSYSFPSSLPSPPSLSPTPPLPLQTAIKTFYFLIFGAAALRAIWFFIPSDVLEPSYAPAEVWAFQTPHWEGTLISEILLSGGSLCLFAIFVLIIIYWADLLKKVFKPVRKHEPMTTFLTIMGSLAAFEIANFSLFCAGIYSSQVMTLLDSIMLALLSMVCVVEISIFSHRFRTVLTTLGAINQVPTDSQVRTIVWITVFGNVFFVLRAAIELFLAATFFALWKEKKPLDSLATPRNHFWDVYLLIKHTLELLILFLMLWTLQSRRTTHHHHGANSQQQQQQPQGGSGLRSSGAGEGGGGSGSGGSYLSMASTASTGSKLPNRREYTEVKDVEGGGGGGEGGGKGGAPRAPPGRFFTGTTKKAAVAGTGEGRSGKSSGSGGGR